MTFPEFIEYNFAPIIGLIFQIIILFCSKNFSNSDRKAFYLAIVLEVFELVTYNVEYMFSSFTYYSYWRTFLSVCGYLVRPMLVYPFIMMIREYGKFAQDKRKYLDLIPYSILVVIEIIALLPNNQLVFYFDENNIFHRGPLGYASQVVTVFYLVEVVVQIILAVKSTRKINTLLVSTIFVYCTFSMIFESIFDIRSLGVCACIFSVDLFMFALQSNHLTWATEKLKNLSEVDSLSGLSNRYYGEKCIREDIDASCGGLFFILDINKFKQINDTFGHFIGDEAIVKVSKALKNASKENDIVMRLGGDEFAIYHHGSDINPQDYANNLIKEIEKIRLSSDETYRITISIGYASVEPNSNKTFDSIYHEADDKLYKAKLHGGNYFEM